MLLLESVLHGYGPIIQSPKHIFIYMTEEPSAPSALLLSYLNPQRKHGAPKRRRGRLAEPKPLQSPWLYESVPKEVPPVVELTPSAIRARARRPEDRSLTQAKKKEKESRAWQGVEVGKYQFQRCSIFKQGNHMGVGRLSKQDIRLPALQRRRDEQQGQGRRVVRIALDKLKRLQPQQVKKRFLLKYQLSHQE